MFKEKSQRGLGQHPVVAGHPLHSLPVVANFPCADTVITYYSILLEEIHHLGLVG